MVINHVPVNTPSHMRQTIGMESAAACTSMYDGSHPWANDGPRFVVVWGHFNPWITKASIPRLKLGS